MAAYFVFNENGKEYELMWHIGNNLNHIINRIKHLQYVQIDGDEADILYGIGMSLEGKRVHKLSANESRIYALLQQERYKDSKGYEDMECKINTFLKGNQNSNSN